MNQIEIVIEMKDFWRIKSLLVVESNCGQWFTGLLPGTRCDPHIQCRLIISPSGTSVIRLWAEHQCPLAPLHARWCTINNRITGLCNTLLCLLLDTFIRVVILKSRLPWMLHCWHYPYYYYYSNTCGHSKSCIIYNNLYFKILHKVCIQDIHL